MLVFVSLISALMDEENASLQIIDNLYPTAIMLMLFEYQSVWIVVVGCTIEISDRRQSKNVSRYGGKLLRQDDRPALLSRKLLKLGPFHLALISPIPKKT